MRTHKRPTPLYPRPKPRPHRCVGFEVSLGVFRHRSIFSSESCLVVYRPQPPVPHAANPTSPPPVPGCVLIHCQVCFSSSCLGSTRVVLSFFAHARKDKEQTSQGGRRTESPTLRYGDVMTYMRRVVLCPVADGGVEVVRAHHLLQYVATVIVPAVLVMKIHSTCHQSKRSLDAPVSLQYQ